MTRIALLTAAFPYHPGEQFLEEEIRHWAAVPDLELVLMPLSAKGEPRALPAGVQVDLSLARSRASQPLTLGIPAALGSAVFWRELRMVLARRDGRAWCAAKALAATANLLRSRKALRRVLATRSFDLVYSYWNDTSALAAAMLREEGQIRHLVTRIHNYELYEEEMPYSYIPLKRQFIGQYDRIFAVAEHGRRYVEQVFGVSRPVADLSRLGVALPPRPSATSSSGSLHLVSISYCVPYKRIDVIIDAVSRFADRHPQLNIRWTHIGAGPMFDQLRQRAMQALNHLNMTWEMKGHLENAQVHAFLGRGGVDLLVNASKNEGVPVSVMEAMGHGIPAIAPDVGGMAELVTEDCGMLLPKPPSSEELARAIDQMLPRLKDDELREAARQKVAMQFHAERNYACFVKNLLQLAGGPVASVHSAPDRAAA